MPVPTLSAAQPVVVNKVYDRVWVEEIVISASDPNADASARVRLRLFAEVDGSRELAPDAVILGIDNVLEASATDPDLDAAVTAIMGYVAKLAVDRGVVAPPA